MVGHEDQNFGYRIPVTGTNRIVATRRVTFPYRSPLDRRSVARNVGGNSERPVPQPNNQIFEDSTSKSVDPQNPDDEPDPDGSPEDPTSEEEAFPPSAQRVQPFMPFRPEFRSAEGTSATVPTRPTTGSSSLGQR